MKEMKEAIPTNETIKVNHVKELGTKRNHNIGRNKSNMAWKKNSVRTIKTAG